MMMNFIALLFSISILSSSSHSEACRDHNKALISSFSVDLIHRDSILSPFYNSSLSHSEIIMKAARRSASRIKHYQGGGGAVITPNRGDYLMKMYMGTPLVELHAAADTGSDLVWVPCLPCGGCDPQNAFDPAKSSTFNVLPCDSQPCASLPRQSCGDSNQCRYLYKYGDQSFTTGDLASDTINFGNGVSVSSPSTVIGCGHDNRFEDNTGIAGLGGGPLSLISQLGDQVNHKFSYCLLPFSSSTTSKLIFGDQPPYGATSSSAVISTPLFTKTPTTFYYVNLEGISIGHKTVQTGQTGGNIVVDSGTTLTVLESGFYGEVRDAVREAVGVEPVVDPPEPLDLCFGYEPGMMKDGVEFVLHFTGGDLRLHGGNMFSVKDNLICLLVIPSEGMSILGNIAQINFQVEFDLLQRKVSFAPADCSAI